LQFLVKGINEINKEIEILEKLNGNKDLIEDYSESLINFSSEAVDELEKMNELFDDINNMIDEFCEKMGEKKGTKLKDLLTPIYNFIKTIK
jgi:hypothetical protein